MDMNLIWRDYVMNEDNKIKGYLIHGWAIDVRNYAEWYGISLKVATREIKKACIKMGFHAFWDTEAVGCIILNRYNAHVYHTLSNSLEESISSGKYEYLDNERVIKKNGNGWKAKIYKSTALKQYIKEVLKP